MIPIRRVHARHIHSGTDQPLDDSCSVGCRTQRADDLGSLPGGLGHSIVSVLQWLGTWGFEVVETIHACFSGRSIGGGSVATRKHFNLHGEFDFSDERMVDIATSACFNIGSGILNGGWFRCPWSRLFWIIDPVISRRRRYNAHLVTFKQGSTGIVYNPSSVETPWLNSTKAPRILVIFIRLKRTWLSSSTTSMFSWISGSGTKHSGSAKYTALTTLVRR
jgi:hypothetical protein